MTMYSAVARSPWYMRTSVTKSNLASSGSSSRIASFLTGGSFESCAQGRDIVSRSESAADPTRQPSALTRLWASTATTPRGDERPKTHPLAALPLARRLLAALNVDDDAVSRHLKVGASVAVDAADGRAAAVETVETDIDAGEEVMRVEALGALWRAVWVSSAVTMTRTASRAGIEWGRTRRGRRTFAVDGLGRARWSESAEDLCRNGDHGCSESNW